MGEAERLDPNHLVALYQRLPDEDRGMVINLVEHLARKADPVAWALDNAPLDDEPTTEADLKAIAEAESEIAGGEPRITLEELEAELGL